MTNRPPFKEVRHTFCAVRDPRSSIRNPPLFCSRHRDRPHFLPTGRSEPSRVSRLHGMERASKNVELDGVKSGLWSGKDDVKFRTIDPSDDKINKASLYKLMISGVTPRPVGFISSISSEGQTNLAPFSYFNIACHDPPMLMVSINHPGPDKLKHTCDFILQTKNFTTNIISEPFVDAANYTSIDAPKGVSEWALSGLTPKKSDTIDAPRVGESGFSMECELEHHYHLHNDNKDRTSTIIIGRIKRFHVRDDLIDDSLLVDTERLLPVSRLGGITYGRTREVYETPRPVWEKEKERDEVKKILGSDGKAKV
ncbi:BQ5605_C002g01634 [Microbotryum silenes-dioicae]|uniref:BQ5605_C002g01634 protein n=1 Tax=Microbotryum silenes-dioicae TaxID=796604 RepID=A0A2X0NWS6_9BASI|nr:BQ5605_C002g01634 [Microbotryum silenes-dioicae]